MFTVFKGVIYFYPQHIYSYHLYFINRKGQKAQVECYKTCTQSIEYNKNDDDAEDDNRCYTLPMAKTEIRHSME